MPRGPGTRSAYKARDSRYLSVGCGEPWLRATNLAARYRCVSCLHRFELRSECPNCGAHSTIARMSDTANVICRNCGGSMLQAI